MAITGRRVPAGVVEAVGRLDVAGESERTSQTFVPATMSAPAITAAQMMATWLFLTGISSSS